MGQSCNIPAVSDLTPLFVRPTLCSNLRHGHSIVPTATAVNAGG
jgi:hypothetical protein